MLVVARDAFPLFMDYQTLQYSGHPLPVRQSVDLPTGRWSATSEISSARVLSETLRAQPKDRALSVVNGVDYFPSVNARGSVRLLRRRHLKSDIPPSAILGTCAKIHNRRGLTRTPLEGEHPIEQFKDSDLLIRPYTQNVETAIRRYTGTSISSGTTSPTLIDSQSAASLSHNGWTTGNTTERSSLDSSYCFDDYDRTTASTVSQHYENFESLLYEGEGSRENLVLQADMKKECQEWSSQFDYFRVLGQQIVKENRTEEDDEKKGFKYIPTLPAASSPALTRADSRETSFVYSESQGLTLTGQKVEMKQVSVYDDFSSSGHYLVEEVIEEEGLYEDIIAVDYKNNYDDFTEFKKQITPRRRRVGYPPVTPIACVKDSVTSAAFDHIWQEIMSWLRPLLLRFSSEITDSKAEVIQYSLPPQPPLQAQPSFILQTRQNSFHRSNTHMSQSIDGILHISSIPLVHRVEMPESHAPVAASAPPAPTKTVVRKVRLKPLPTLPRPQPVKQSSDLLKVRGSTAINLDNLPPPPPSRHGTLPPIDLEPKKFQPSHRAASAIDNKDNRHLPNKPHFMSEQTRPNTTHAMRYDSMFGSSSLRRSSTPLGSSFSSRLHLPTSKSLDVRGSSLQPPDIIEDQQESPAEDSYRPQWTGPPAANTHINFGRNRLSLR
uniref:DUF3719 domain-containing protein n=1 Tax=Biomphalaria glabrata TaxID=6526 RepID=A0A2C9L8K9_BIOGL